MSGDKHILKPYNSVNCPKCHKQISVQLRSLSQYAVCPSCNTIINLLKGSSGRSFGKKHGLDILKLGDKGVIDEVEYKVVGQMTLKEKGSVYKWEEFTLYNPLKGFAWLSVYEGHWIFLKITKDHPRGLNYNVNSIRNNEIDFKRFLDYDAELHCAQGEFEYNPEEVEDYHYNEFIAPPKILIECKRPDDLFWLEGKHIDSSEVKKIFNVLQMPSEKGIGAVQPTGVWQNYISNFKFFLIYAAILLIIMFSMNSGSESKKIVEISGVTTGIVDSVGYVRTETFKLSKDLQNLEFSMHADVSNGWMEMEVYLINERNGKEYHFVKGVEYYYGYTDGENWSEGDKDEAVFLSSVPKGEYYILLIPVGQPGNQNNYNLVLKSDVPMYSNFFLLLFLGALWPTIQYVRGRNKEFVRWQNSNIVQTNYY